MQMTVYTTVAGFATVVDTTSSTGFDYTASTDRSYPYESGVYDLGDFEHKLINPIPLRVEFIDGYVFCVDPFTDIWGQGDNYQAACDDFIINFCDEYLELIEDEAILHPVAKFRLEKIREYFLPNT